MTTTKKDISIQIQDIFDKNELNDLKRFLNKRQCLNCTNSYLIYLFHFVQSAGILTSSIGAGNNDISYIWIGIGLNLFATLIHIYEKTNNSILKKLMIDIQHIKSGSYIDESEIINPLENIDDFSTMKPLTTPSSYKNINSNHTNHSMKTPLLNNSFITDSSYNTF
jgi:hypothetical protein